MLLRNYENRRLDWSLTAVSFLFGLLLALPAASLASSGYDEVTATISERMWGVLLILSGISHAISLHINGRAWWTPFVRLAVSFIGAQVVVGLGVSIISYNPPSAGGWFYLIVGVVCYGSCMLSAAKDCGRELKIREAQNGKH